MLNLGSIKVGFNAKFAPLAFDDNGIPRGVLIERFTRIFTNAGISFTLFPVRLPDMFDDLATGRVDALAGIAATMERRDKLAFSKPLVLTGGALFALKESTWPGDDALQNSKTPPWRVVTPAKGPLINPIRSQFPHIHLDTCTDYDDALQHVVSRWVDAAALNWHVGAMLCDNNYPGLFQKPTAPFFSVPLAIAVNSGDPMNILRILNSHIPDQWS